VPIDNFVHQDWCLMPDGTVNIELLICAYYLYDLLMVS